MRWRSTSIYYFFLLLGTFCLNNDDTSGSWVTSVKLRSVGYRAVTVSLSPPPPPRVGCVTLKLHWFGVYSDTVKCIIFDILLKSQTTGTPAEKVIWAHFLYNKPASLTTVVPVIMVILIIPPEPHLKPPIRSSVRPRRFHGDRLWEESAWGFAVAMPNRFPVLDNLADIRCSPGVLRLTIGNKADFKIPFGSSKPHREQCRPWIHIKG